MGTPKLLLFVPSMLKKHIVDEEIDFVVGGLPRGSCSAPVIEGVAPPYVDECGLVFTPTFSTKEIVMLTVMAMARKMTLLIALGKVESLTPPKMRLIAMKEEEKALKMPHKMKGMKKRDLAMKILKII